MVEPSLSNLELPPLPSHPVLLWNTLKYLRLIQWVYRLKNQFQTIYHAGFSGRLRAGLNRRTPQQPMRRPQSIAVKWFHKTYDGQYGMFTVKDVLEKRFRFLNCEKKFNGPIRWKNPEFTYLWDFNLHYFEYLPPLFETSGAATERQKNVTTATDLLDDWIENNPCSSQPGWHPYTTSLRVVNWIKSFLIQNSLETNLRLRSLYMQVLFLERNIEGHLMVNHVWENARALIFAGVFFTGDDASRWYNKGIKILKRELSEELLSNGGHFERSPMYHALLTEGLLDLYAYLSANNINTEWLDAPLQGMCQWLNAIRCPDGWFPLFNDAAVGISASADEILINAERILGYHHAPELAPVRDCDGFHVLDGKAFFCIADGAPIGPDYNPGHAHADNLTFEAYYKNERLVVDPGTFHYEADPLRRWYRSSLSHNTVVINDMDQSEVWGGFRVARRSNPYYSVSWKNEELLIFHGIYKNCLDIALNISHERLLIVRPAEFILVWDTITAHDGIKAHSYCQFGPDWKINMCGSQNYFNLHHCNGNDLFCLNICQGVKLDHFQANYAPEFGHSQAVERVRFSTVANKRAEFGYMITVNPPDKLDNFSVHKTENIFTFSLKGSTFELKLKESLS